MSEAENEFLLESSGVIVYGTGVAILTAYPQAAGYYRTYFGSNNQPPTVAKSLRIAIDSNAGLDLLNVGRAAAPLQITSPYYAPNGLAAANLGNAAVVDAANSIAAQYGRNLISLSMFGGSAAERIIIRYRESPYLPGVPVYAATLEATQV
jgi:hypothetical protein